MKPIRERILRRLYLAEDPSEGLTHYALRRSLGSEVTATRLRYGVLDLIRSGEAMWGTYYDTNDYLVWRGRRMMDGLDRMKDRSNGPRGTRPSYILWATDFAPPHVRRRAELDREGVEGAGCTCWDYINAEFPEGSDEHCPTHGHQWDREADRECASCIDARAKVQFVSSVRLPPEPS